MKLNVKIHKIKSINDLEINLPIDKGLYAITGQNGSGKSTVVTCASTVFFTLPMNDYFGTTAEDARIDFDLEGAKRSWFKDGPKWKQFSNGQMSIKGFYEGSLIFGNRFRNTNFETLKKIDQLSTRRLIEAPEFIRENLGLILQNNKNFYEKLFILDSNNNPNFKFSRDIFYYQKGEKRVSQFHMSTGENLMISILNSIDIRNKDRANLSKPCLMFLDEIELALHPSSLKRFTTFLREISNTYNYAIYFSTHSIELISGIKPSNIFFIERYADDSMEVINPCYPAYATRILYDHHAGYDYVILVEDDLAKSIITRLLKNNHLFTNKLIHVLPAGGYSNVIDLADEVVSSNLIGTNSKIIIILDGDVKDKATAYFSKMQRQNNIPLNYLPIESLEKYLKAKLVDNVDRKLFRLLSDFVFQQKSLNTLIQEYQNSKGNDNDNSGKKFYGVLDNELRARNKNREEIVEMVVNYLFENNDPNLQKITQFLKNQLQ
jgi:energy-coupling factor transporter ATP-binding protein EcfA2